MFCTFPINFLFRTFTATFRIIYMRASLKIKKSLSDSSIRNIIILEKNTTKSVALALIFLVKIIS